MTGYIVQTVLVLLLVCVLAAAVLYGARKLGVGRGHGPLRLVGHLPLDARRGIFLVRVGDSRVLVVGAAEGGLTKLGEMAEADETGSRSCADLMMLRDWQKLDKKALNPSQIALGGMPMTTASSLWTGSLGD